MDISIGKIGDNPSGLFTAIETQTAHIQRAQRHGTILDRFPEGRRFLSCAEHTHCAPPYPDADSTVVSTSSLFGKLFFGKYLRIDCLGSVGYSRLLPKFIAFN